MAAATSKQEIKVPANDALFVDPASSTNIPIVLIDASGSTMHDFKDVSVLEQQITALLQHDKSTQFRALFWNSNPSGSDYFKNGIYLVPHVLNRDSLMLVTKLTKSHVRNSCLTMPHLGLKAILPEWFSPSGSPTTICLLTDGEMCGGGHIREEDLKINLAHELKQITSNRPDLHIKIITVQSQVMEYNESDHAKIAPGADVYRTIMDHKLTGIVDKFVSITLNNLTGFCHIDKIRAPPGCLPYGPMYFSALRMPEFIAFFLREVKKIKEGSSTKMDSDLTLLIQRLSATLAVWSKDKPPALIEDVIHMYCNFFEGTPFSPQVVHMVLKKAVSDEIGGTAEIFANIRKQVKEKFKEAQGSLERNVKTALGIYGPRAQVLTLPFDNHIVSAFSGMMTETIKVAVARGPPMSFPSSGVRIQDGLFLPVFPVSFVPCHSNPLTDQSMRQWIRSIVASLYNVQVMDDCIIYLVMGINLIAFLSTDLSPQVKQAYRELVLCMLRKSRLNAASTTEMDWLLTGEAPIPNSGRIEDLYDHLGQVRTKLGLTTKLNPMTLWLAMCIAIQLPKLTVQQYRHCRSHWEMDCASSLSSSSLLSSVGKGTVEQENEIKQVELQHLISSMFVVGRDYQPYKEHPFGAELCLDYSQCPITLEETTTTGGWIFSPHTNLGGQICSPIGVISQVGYEMLTKDPERIICSVCYASLKPEGLVKVEKKPNDSMTTTNLVDGETLARLRSIYTSRAPHHHHQDMNKKADGKVEREMVAAMSSLSLRDPNKIMVVLRGTVGAGKTTFTEELTKLLKASDCLVCVANTDQYGNKGFNGPKAVEAVTRDIRSFNSIICDEKQKKVLIVDTCGDRFNERDLVFGNDLSNWTTHIYEPSYLPTDPQGYLAWSLYNVLCRPKFSASSNYWLSLHGGMSAKKCAEIHGNKARGLNLNSPYLGNHPDIAGNAWKKSGSNLSKLASEYAAKLPSPTLTAKDFVKKLLS